MLGRLQAISVGFHLNRFFVFNILLRNVQVSMTDGKDEVRVCQRRPPEPYYSNMVELQEYKT